MQSDYMFDKISMFCLLHRVLKCYRFAFFKKIAMIILLQCYFLSKKSKISQKKEFMCLITPPSQKEKKEWYTFLWLLRSLQDLKVMERFIEHHWMTPFSLHTSLNCRLCNIMFWKCVNLDQSAFHSFIHPFTLISTQHFKVRHWTKNVEVNFSLNVMLKNRLHYGPNTCNLWIYIHFV